MSSMVHLGLNAYCWDDARQNRLLVECLAPLVRKLGQDLGPVRFWFDRLDTRGPHLFAVLGVPEEARGEAADRLAAGVAGLLAEHPSRGLVSRPAAERRHEASRRFALCAADREPGLAPEGSFLVFDHPVDGYPFGLGAGLPPPAAGRLWELAHGLALWSTDRLAERPDRPPLLAAARLLSGFDRELRRACGDPDGWWEYCATRLLPGLSRREDRAEVGFLHTLAAAIGEGNLERFERVWSAAEAGQAASPWPDLPELVGRLFAGHGAPSPDGWRLAREILHSCCKQLAVHTDREVPLTLFAWYRGLSRAAAA